MKDSNWIKIFKELGSDLMKIEEEECIRLNMMI
jgi:hypothetical protein